MQNLRPSSRLTESESVFHQDLSPTKVICGQLQLEKHGSNSLILKLGYTLDSSMKFKTLSPIPRDCDFLSMGCKTGHIIFMFSVGFQCAAGSENCGPHLSGCTFKQQLLLYWLHILVPLQILSPLPKRSTTICQANCNRIILLQGSYWETWGR